MTPTPPTRRQIDEMTRVQSEAKAQNHAHSVLVLPLKGVYFDQIAAGVKPQEFRLCTDYWRKRLEGRAYDSVVITKGYPAAHDLERRRTFPWRGYEVKTITHEFFGPDPVEVFAINVGPAPSAGTCVTPSQGADHED